MRLLIIQHEDSSPAGSTLQWLKDNHVSYQITRVAQEELPPADQFTGLIVLGGEMNVDQEKEFPWLKKEKAFIQAWIQSSKPLLGICLGGQLIAEILGARVSRHHFWEIGWCDVKVLSGSGLPSAGTVLPAFQWHGYTFDIPSGAELTLEGAHWRNQGFRYGAHVLAFQFHPEAGLEFLEECAEAQQTSQKVSETMMSAEEIRERKSDLNLLRKWYFELLSQHFSGKK